MTANDYSTLSVLVLFFMVLLPTAFAAGYAVARIWKAAKDYELKQMHRKEQKAKPDVEQMIADLNAGAEWLRKLSE